MALLHECVGSCVGPCLGHTTGWLLGPTWHGVVVHRDAQQQGVFAVHLVRHGPVYGQGYGSTAYGEHVVKVSPGTVITKQPYRLGVSCLRYL